jgi:predicted regulator of Ras-like GTPase activity (Roadblock/LC7/MglB family)
MTFREILAQVVDRTPGARAAVMMGSDGIPVEEYEAPGSGMDLSTVAVECQRLLEESGKVLGTLEGDLAGDLEELVFRTSRLQLMFHPIDEEYYLVIALDRDGFLGKARYLVAGLLHEIRGEL